MRKLRLPKEESSSGFVGAVVTLSLILVFAVLYEWVRPDKNVESWKELRYSEEYIKDDADVSKTETAFLRTSYPAVVESTEVRTCNGVVDSVAGIFSSTNDNVFQQISSQEWFNEYKVVYIILGKDEYVKLSLYNPKKDDYRNSREEEHRIGRIWLSKDIDKEKRIVIEKVRYKFRGK